MVRKCPQGLPSIACNCPFGAEALGTEFYSPSDPSGMEAQPSIASERAEMEEARDCRSRLSSCAVACSSSSNQACQTLKRVSDFDSSDREGGDWPLFWRLREAAMDRIANQIATVGQLHFAQDASLMAADGLHAQGVQFGNFRQAAAARQADEDVELSVR